MRLLSGNSGHAGDSIRMGESDPNPTCQGRLLFLTGMDPQVLAMREFSLLPRSHAHRADDYSAATAAGLGKGAWRLPRKPSAQLVRTMTDLLRLFDVGVQLVLLIPGLAKPQRRNDHEAVSDQNEHADQ
jgi:hypothetical protein